MGWARSFIRATIKAGKCFFGLLFDRNLNIGVGFRRTTAVRQRGASASDIEQSANPALACTAFVSRDWAGVACLWVPTNKEEEPGGQSQQHKKQQKSPHGN